MANTDVPPVGAITLILEEEKPESSRNLPRRILRLTRENPTAPIGRASKTASKGLVPAEDNGFFDSPVVSRTHAEVEASIFGDEVTLVDKGSMHGTSINDKRLEVNVPSALKTGDRVCFGAHVARGLETFVPTVCTVTVSRAAPAAPVAPVAYGPPHREPPSSVVRHANPDRPVAERARSYCAPESVYDSDSDDASLSVDEDFYSPQASTTSVGSAEKPALAVADPAVDLSALDDTLPCNTSESSDDDDDDDDEEDEDDDDDGDNENENDKNKDKDEPLAGTDAKAASVVLSELGEEDPDAEGEGMEDEDMYDDDDYDDDDAMSDVKEYSVLGYAVDQSYSSDDGGDFLEGQMRDMGKAKSTDAGCLDALRATPALDQSSQPQSDRPDQPEYLSRVSSLPSLREMAASDSVARVHAFVPPANNKKIDITSILNPTPLASDSASDAALNAALDTAPETLPVPHPWVSTLSPLAVGTDTASGLAEAGRAAVAAGSIAAANASAWFANEAAAWSAPFAPAPPAAAPAPKAPQPTAAPAAPAALTAQTVQTVEPAVVTAAPTRPQTATQTATKRKLAEISADDAVPALTTQLPCCVLDSGVQDTAQPAAPAPKRRATRAATEQVRAKSSFRSAVEKISMAALGGALGSAVVLGSLIYTAPTF